MATDVVVPSLGESVSEGMIGRWLKRDGDIVGVDEPIMELETDKATMEIAAQAPGRLSIQQPEGTLVATGSVVGTIEETDEAATPAAVKETVAATASPSSAEAAAPSPPPPSPSVRKLITEHDVDTSSLHGSGPRGRLTRDDVLGAVQGDSPAKAPPATPAASPQEDVERVPMSMLRRKIAERLVSAQREAAILTTFNEIDMSAVMNMRKRYKESFKEKHGVNLGFMSLFGRACVQALKEVPAVNSQIDGNDLLYHRHVHLGVAVSTDRGLVVPVIRHADQMSLHELEGAISEQALKARDGKITPADLSGGTFTISNGGIFGSLMSTPILNPPQSGILGMHKIEERPVAVDGQVVIRPMMYVALSYDHRVIDGKESVTFLVKVKERLEDPTRLFLEI